MSTVIRGVEPGSPADRAKILPGETLLTLNGRRVRDVLDYKFYGYEPELQVGLEGPQGARTVRVKKREGEDLGLSFETYLIDRPRSCANKCVFCFIDQLPKGMRETLYFKDDDARLSFLMGNYVSMTNLSQADIDRIIEMHISPIHISVHATEPELRAQMLGNPRGAGGYGIMERFSRAGIQMQCQIVLCPGLNDGEHLDRTLSDLMSLVPQVSSVSVVPVGLSRHREGLCPLVPVTAEKAREVLSQVERAGERCLERHGERVFYCGDEFYLKAGRPLPESAYYGEFQQLENGIGMLSLFLEEFRTALRFADLPHAPVSLSLATGMAAKPFLELMMAELGEKWPEFKCRVFGIPNRFFGEAIDVAGLVVGGDLIRALRLEHLERDLFLPEAMLRQGETVFLDDVSVRDVERELKVRVTPIPNDGGVLLDKILELAEER